MKEFEIEIGAMVTVHLSDYFVVKAETKEEAVAKAKEKFSKWIDENYAYSDYDEVVVGDILVGDDDC